MKNKNIIVVIGGAGFVGSNLIKLLLKKTKLKIISLDSYYSGSKKNWGDAASCLSIELIIWSQVSAPGILLFLTEKNLTIYSIGPIL